MTNLLSGRHKYLTNKNTKKGQKVRKISALSALKNGYCRVQILQGAVFFEMISFFLHSVSANLMIAKKRGNARKTPEIVRFQGFEAMISFLASLYGWDIGIRTPTYRVRVCCATVTQYPIGCV